MTRDELRRWADGHAAAASTERALLVSEADAARAVRHSLSLIATLHATIPADVIERQREADDARVRDIWNRLRASRK